MILVLFFCTIIYSFIFIFILLVLSNLKIKIKKGDIKLMIFLLNKFPILKIHLNVDWITKKLSRIRTKNKIKVDKNTLSMIKALSPKIEMLNLSVKLGFENAALTSFTVTAICIVISNLLYYAVETKNIKKIKYKIEPIFRREK